MTPLESNRSIHPRNLFLISLILLFIAPVLFFYLASKITLPHDPTSLVDVFKLFISFLPNLLVFLITGLPELVGVTSQNSFINILLALAVDSIIILIAYHAIRRWLRTNFVSTIIIAISATICLAEITFMFMLLGMAILSQGL